MELADWQLEAQPLIKQGVVILPNEIEYDAYVEMAWAIPAATCYAMQEDKTARAKLLCSSNGGTIGSVFAICDLVKNYGTTGIVIGSAISGGSIIWAACKDRYYGELARLFIHECLDYTSSYAVDGNGFNITQSEYHDKRRSSMVRVNARVAKIYADASIQSAEWWLNIMKEGNSHYYELWAEDLDSLCMGELIENDDAITTDRDGSASFDLLRNVK